MCYKEKKIVRAVRLVSYYKIGLQNFLTNYRVSAVCGGTLSNHRFVYDRIFKFVLQVCPLRDRSLKIRQLKQFSLFLKDKLNI